MDVFQKCFDYRDPEVVRGMGIYPYFRMIASAQDPVVSMNDRPVIMMGSNNYLGLTNHPEVKRAAADALQEYGTGTAGSRFLNGTLEIHVKLERAKEVGEQMYYADMGDDSKKGMVCSPMTCTKIESIENFKSFQVKAVLGDNVALANDVNVKVRRSSE